ncbi:hypothetical protein [Kitasatospora sp. NPDC058190]|uniref:hypothetical protein n=1 Tax=Kitasatospora sp. NPDC058190 TaxID=3346371 RepID=UPI0036DE11D1
MTADQRAWTPGSDTRPAWPTPPATDQLADNFVAGLTAAHHHLHLGHRHAQLLLHLPPAIAAGSGLDQQ